MYFYLKFKTIVLVSSFIFQFFAFVHIHNNVLKLVNVVKLDTENENFILTLSNAVNVNVEICNVDSKLQIQSCKFQRLLDGA